MTKFLLMMYLTFWSAAPTGLWSCRSAVKQIAPTPASTVQDPVRPGAWQTERYYSLLHDKSFALVCNHTATIGMTHLVDTLIRAGLRPQKLFAPEHGFRGDMPDGHHIGHKKDDRTGLEILSVYGQHKKPQPEDLAGLDLMVFDIQDVGARFYTYLSTLHYVMEACAEQGLPLIVLDRPNPNGHYLDGPVLDPAFRSFVGMHPVPVVYGMTIGEYAMMINGEGWLTGGVKCDLTVVPLANYRRDEPYYLPERPSPNLPNMRAVWLYPSLCFFEGTPLSVGRGTDDPFQLIGHPRLQAGDTWFMPVTRPESVNPPQKNRDCRGFDLTALSPEAVFRQGRLDISWLLRAWDAFPDKEDFFLQTGFFDKLAGSDLLRQQLREGKSESEIRASWQPGLEAFRARRARYLLYP